VRKLTSILRHPMGLRHPVVSVYMTVCTETATSPKSIKWTNSDSSASWSTNPNWHFGSIWICTEEFEFLYLWDFGGVAISVETVVVNWQCRAMSILRSQQCKLTLSIYNVEKSARHCQFTMTVSTEIDIVNLHCRKISSTLSIYNDDLSTMSIFENVDLTLVSTLQHTATHSATYCNTLCNTLQHTLQHALQQTANTLQHTATQPTSRTPRQ